VTIKDIKSQLNIFRLILNTRDKHNVTHNRHFTAAFGFRKIERSEYANQTLQ